MNNQIEDPIFIVGMYKSGTSWLLSIFAEHPDVRAFREIDTVRAYFDGQPDHLVPRDLLERTKHFLTRYPYSRMDEEQLLRMLNPETRGDALTQKRAPRSGPLTFSHLSSDAQNEIIELLLKAQDYSEFLHDFVAANQQTAGRAVFKSADQLPVSDKITEAFDAAKRIVIIRDGRDAAVSALHFRRLMAKQSPPWLKDRKEIPVDELFRGWLSRIRLLRKLMRDGSNIHVLRYEDLQRRFQETVSQVFVWCGLDADTDQIARIEAITSFKNKTGREPGMAAEHVIRKGIVGDFMNQLTSAECQRLWDLGGAELTEFGYSENGCICEMPLSGPDAF